MDSNNVQPAFATDADMDIDMDIDLTTADDIDAFDTEGITLDVNPTQQGATHSAPAVQEPQLEKVHVNGVDNLTTAQVKAYALQYYPSDHYVRIEWIDDSNANIVYENGNAALEALHNITDTDYADPSTTTPLTERKAKPFFDNPDVQLQVRLAVVTDVKAPRAREASRFYLMNPDKDPWERKKRQGDRRNGGGGEGYNRRRYDEREQRRRKDHDTYDVDMYDEDGAGAGRSQNDDRRGRRGSVSDDSVDQRRGRRRDTRSKNLDDLLPSTKSDGRLRDRSASPLRDGDGRYGFAEDDGAAHRRVRRRSYSPPSNRTQAGNARKELFPGQGGNTKELFPAQGSRSTLLSSTASSPNPSTAASTKDLFPSKSQHTQKRSRELFPHKTAHSNHRRQDALDPRDFSEGGAFINNSRSLEDRITGGPNQSGRSHGRLNGDDQGFSVRGTADTSGFSIRGAADAKELFPMKTGGGSNAGKELFGEKIQGRGGPRRKAEDMYF